MLSSAHKGSKIYEPFCLKSYKVLNIFEWDPTELQQKFYRTNAFFWEYFSVAAALEPSDNSNISSEKR